jgi:hypothetical protein
MDLTIGGDSNPEPSTGNPPLLTVEPNTQEQESKSNSSPTETVLLADDFNNNVIDTANWNPTLSSAASSALEYRSPKRVSGSDMWRHIPERRFHWQDFDYSARFIRAHSSQDGNARCTWPQ